MLMHISLVRSGLRLNNKDLLLDLNMSQQSFLDQKQSRYIHIYSLHRNNDLRVSIEMKIDESAVPWITIY